ncbi:LysM domain-containing protein [Ralstonia sp. UNC404CL21Col]|uniref:LysM peptidoglycan-binding domain-containing protein n=1 Tax=Ralstonia sp. UNC404CL21Col TaxID=1380362 RepID=UPI0004856488|nr:LysM domain-containing protein [Ralstonia sp. UNC404CL21Col]
MVTKAQAKPKTDFERWQDYINTAAQHPDRWNGYDCDIQAAVAEYNRHLMGNAGYLPLDWQIVKAMVWVETGADSEAWSTRPMQIGNLGDPALNTLLRGEEGSDLIVPPAIRTRLNAGLARTMPAWNIRAGVGYLLTRMAKFDVRSVRDADDKVYEVAVKAGDSFDKIARAQGSTLAEMRALNPNAATLKPGQVVKYRKAAMRKVITGWRPVTTQNIAVLYNHGDAAYIRKLDYVLTLIPKIGTAACK